jgi:hypothetical protein
VKRQAATNSRANDDRDPRRKGEETKAYRARVRRERLDDESSNHGDNSLRLLRFWEARRQTSSSGRKAALKALYRQWQTL